MGSDEVVRALEERVKELTALHAVARIVLEGSSTSSEQMAALVRVLPPAMQYPALATSCIHYGAEQVSTPDHRTTPWTLTVGFDTCDGVHGDIEVSYREQPPTSPSFLDEETALLQSIAGMMKVALDRAIVHRQLREANERLTLAFQAAGMGVWEWNVTTGQVFWSDHLGSMVGLETRSGSYRDNEERIHPEDREYVFSRLEQAANGGDDLSNLSFRMRRDGSGWRHMLASAAITREPPARATRILAALVDVSERQALEEGLRHAQKLEALGQVAGGVAHDFNNLLAIILAGSEMLCEDLSADHPGRETAEDIREATKRGAALTKQLLAFSRKATFEPAKVDLCVLVAKLEPLLARIAKSPIKIGLDLDRATCSVWADPVQIDQVVMNLVVNARDAMPDGGKVTIRVRGVDASDGRFAAIEVQDTGPGIDDALKARIFEPFFTTKEVGKGTGLGLAVVSRVARQWQGRIELDSAPGAGATFRVLLPQLAR